MTLSTTISESFRRRADTAAFFEAWVGSVLSRMGLYTLHHPFTTSEETGNTVESYANSWDLNVGDRFDYQDQPANLWPRVEVKSVNLAFTSPDSYPHEQVLLCSQNSYMRKWPGVSDTKRHFLLVSRKTGHLLWVPVGTTVEYGVKVYDKSRDESYRAVAVKKGDLRNVKAFAEAISGR
jgi:hypothetical protein